MEEHYRRVVVLLWADMFAGYVIWIMPTYLTNVWKLDFTHASGIQNVYSGLTKALPFFFVLAVDAFLGNVWMLVLSTISYTAGLGLLSMSTPPVLSNSTGTCSAYRPECLGQTQKALFYTSLTLIAVGVSGHIVSLVAFASEQMRKEENGRKDNRTNATEIDPQDAQFQPVDAMISLLRNYGKKSFGIFLALLTPVIGIIALPYVKPWSIRFGVPAICSAVATFLFFTGFCCGGYSSEQKPRQSLLANIIRVLIASTCKISLNHPDDIRNLNKYDEYEGKHYKGFRFLEKAAIVEEGERKRWKLCTVSEVEDTKIAIRMIPFWISFIVSGVITSIGNTYFVEQANHLNYKVGKLKLPITILLIVYEYFKLAFSKQFSGVANNRYAPAMSMIFAVLCCITASKVETRRIDAITDHGLLNKPDEKIPMSAFWLLPQYILLAGHDSIMENSISGFFSNEASSLMTKNILYMTQGITGMGIVGSVLSVYIVGRVSERGGRTNWFQETLNRSRLDNYYWVLAVLSAANFVWYVFAATRYRSGK